MPDPSISRVHAGLEWKRGKWFITDRLSRAGTMLNSLPLEPNEPTPLGAGDVLGIGPWRFRVHFGPVPQGETLRQNRLADSSGHVETVKTDVLLSRAQRQLGLVMDFASAIQEAKDERALGEIVVQAAAQGTGYSRSTLIRPAMGVDRIEVIAAIMDGKPSPAGFPVSSSLVRMSASGQVARLTTDSMLREAQSIISYGIRSAICVPLVVGGTTAAFLYVDNGDVEASTSDDAAAFLAAIARLGSLALAEFSRRALQERHRLLESDLTAARQAQQRLMPPPVGRVGAVSYSTCNRPGRLVAGDLFEVVALSDDRVAVFLGDVAGKGVGAAVLMAAAQTQLRIALRHGKALSDAVAELNNEILARAPAGEFVSLFASVFCPRTRTLEFVDAGHGYWVHIPAGGEPRRVPSAGGLVLGVEPGHIYESESIPIAPADRVVLFSDGVVEQHAPAGGLFGFPAVLEVLAGSTNVAEDVDHLLEKILAFAQSDDLSDDVTIASVLFDPEGVGRVAS